MELTSKIKKTQRSFTVLFLIALWIRMTPMLPSWSHQSHRSSLDKTPNHAEVNINQCSLLGMCGHDIMINLDYVNIYFAVLAKLQDDFSPTSDTKDRLLHWCRFQQTTPTKDTWTPERKRTGRHAAAAFVVCDAYTKPVIVILINVESLLMMTRVWAVPVKTVPEAPAPASSSERIRLSKNTLAAGICPGQDTKPITDKRYVQCFKEPDGSKSRASLRRWS